MMRRKNLKDVSKTHSVDASVFEKGTLKRNTKLQIPEMYLESMQPNLNNDLTEETTSSPKKLKLDYSNLNYFSNDSNGICIVNETLGKVQTVQTGVNINQNEIQERLANWAIDHNITLNAITNLLKILKLHNCFDNLPFDARTLLKSPRTVITKIVTPGSYVHFGLEKEIKKYLTDSTIDTGTVDIAINVDGLPLAKSSKSVLWPILGSILNTKEVFLIGAYHGYEKPSCANTYIKEFVEEAKHLSEMGLNLGDKIINFNVKAVICDAPAKSFILNVKGHGGYSSCTKCTARGKYEDNRVCFPETDAVERRDEDIIHKLDEEFYNEGTCSLLEEIPKLGLVSNVPLDYMHLVCLGVMRKMLTLWTKGSITNSVRVPYREISIISNRLISFKINTPQEFNRKPRSLDDLKNWKATEFRQFLLYTGPLALKGVLDYPKYVNFLSLHVAIRMLIQEPIDELCLQYTKELLVHFVNLFGEIYGMQNLSHNVHGLIHLPNDVKTYGNLDSFSLFKFENFMQKIKRQLRKTEKPLQQLWKRYEELSSIKVIKHEDTKYEGKQSNFIEKINVNGFVFKANSKADSCCSLKSG